MEVDPITFEVVTSSFKTITELMGDTLKRVSRSPIIYDSIDFSNGLLDHKFQLFAQANNCPVHLGSLHFGAQASIERYGGKLDPGDIVVMNDPYMGGLHIPDMTFTMPIYYEGRTSLLCRQPGALDRYGRRRRGFPHAFRSPHRPGGAASSTGEGL